MSEETRIIPAIRIEITIQPNDDFTQIEHIDCQATGCMKSYRMGEPIEKFTDNMKYGFPPDKKSTVLFADKHVKDFINRILAATFLPT